MRYVHDGLATQMRHDESADQGAGALLGGGCGGPRTGGEHLIHVCVYFFGPHRVLEVQPSWTAPVGHNIVLVF